MTPFLIKISFFEIEITLAIYYNCGLYEYTHLEKNLTKLTKLI